MPRQSVYEMPFSRIYEALVAKAERKGRSGSEVDEVIRWLTGYVSVDILDGLTYGQFLSMAPAWNPRSSLITGTVCGIRVEEIEDLQGETLVSEGIDANYMDIINYAVFGIIKLSE